MVAAHAESGERIIHRAWHERGPSAPKTVDVPAADPARRAVVGRDGLIGEGVSRDRDRPVLVRAPRVSELIPAVRPPAPSAAATVERARVVVSGGNHSHTLEAALI